MGNSTQGSNGWRLDKTLPIAIICAFLFQTGTWIWWASNISNNVESLQAYIKDNRDIPKRVIVLETKFDVIRSALHRIETSVDRINTGGKRHGGT